MDVNHMVSAQMSRRPFLATHRFLRLLWGHLSSHLPHVLLRPCGLHPHIRLSLTRVHRTRTVRSIRRTLTIHLRLIFRPMADLILISHVRLKHRFRLLVWYRNSPMTRSRGWTRRMEEAERVGGWLLLVSFWVSEAARWSVIWGGRMSSSWKIATFVWSWRTNLTRVVWTQISGHLMLS